MSEKDYKRKAEQMFQKNTVLINELAQAKELIKRVVEWADADHPKEYFAWIVKDLKQFLKE